MSVPLAHPQVTAFITAVRAELDDLSPDEVDELIDGLEADLNDTVADSGASPAEQFGDPAAYAAELRSAAGLPPRAVSGGRHGAGRIRQTLTESADAVRAQRWWPGVRDFAVTLRPVWWVVRAGLATLVTTGVFGFRSGRVLLFLVFAVASVELGRRRLAGRGGSWRVAIALGNSLALLLLVAAAAKGVSAGSADGFASSEMVAPVRRVAPVSGIWVDGTEVRNLYPYDSQGRPLSGVQLYDQDGRPVAVGDSARTPLEDGQGRVVSQVPAVDQAGEQRWNVYPLRQRTDAYDGSGASTPGTPSPAALPSITPGPLLAPSPQASNAPSPSVTPSPSRAG
jgi:hypothetical protein